MEEVGSMLMETRIVLQYKPDGCRWMDVGQSSHNVVSGPQIAALKTLRAAYTTGETRFIRRDVIETELQEGDLKC